MHIAYNTVSLSKWARQWLTARCLPFPATSEGRIRNLGLSLDFFGTSFPLWIKSRNRDLLGAPAYTLRITVLDYQLLGPLFQQHMHDLEETKENSWTKTNRHLRWLGSYLRLQNKFRVVKVKDLTMWAVFLQRDLIKELPFTWNNHNHTSGELSSKVASEWECDSLRELVSNLSENPVMSPWSSLGRSGISSLSKFCSFSSDKISLVPASPTTEAPSDLPASRPRTWNQFFSSSGYQCTQVPRTLIHNTHVIVQRTNIFQSSQL